MYAQLRYGCFNTWAQQIGLFNTCPPFSLTYGFISETPCRRGQIVNLPVVNKMSWKILPNGVLLHPLHPLSTMLLREEFSILFKNTNSSKALLSAAVCLDGQILQEGGWHSSQHHCRSPKEEKFFRNTTEPAFPGKMPVFWRAVLCFWPCIPSQCSYLILAPGCCGAIRTISKGLDIPFPFSRGYEYLEDYLHWQMKEWACGHTSKRQMWKLDEALLGNRFSSKRVPFGLQYLGLGYVP